MTVETPATRAQAQRAIGIDLFEDFACPWCRLGRANLKQALRDWKGPEVIVRHRPFILDPTIPPEGVDHTEYLTAKFGANATVDAAHAALIEAGQRAGIVFRFDLIRVAPNTVRAHRFAERVPDILREAIVDEIFERHFAKGEHIGDPDILADIAGQHGLDPNMAYVLFDEPNPTESIAWSMAEAQQIGIQGVPFFVVDDRLGVSGAQPPDVLRQVLEMAMTERAAESGGHPQA
jgi:predicted DsbA family dithiol-disulfide isomerase